MQKLLLTNDDGITAPGLKTLYLALKDHYDITIVAPASQQSGRGASITCYEQIHYYKHPWENNTPAWAVKGTPSDCVKIGLSAILQSKPDMVVSGANDESNAGSAVFYSGTMGAAITATLKGIPAIAFSFADTIHDEHSIHLITSHFLQNPPPPGTAININIPAAPIQGLKYTLQGSGYWEDDITTTPHPENGHLAKLNGAPMDLPEDPESDIALLKQGYITATPIKVRHLTDLEHLATHRDHFEALTLLSYPSSR